MVEFDIPKADEVKQQIEKTLEQMAKDASDLFKTTIQNSITTDDWPAKIPLTQIPEPIRNDFEMEVRRDNYHLTKTQTEYLIRKPT